MAVLVPGLLALYRNERGQGAVADERGDLDEPPRDPYAAVHRIHLEKSAREDQQPGGVVRCVGKKVGLQPKPELLTLGLHRLRGCLHVVEDALVRLDPSARASPKAAETRWTRFPRSRTFRAYPPVWDSSRAVLADRFGGPVRLSLSWSHVTHRYD